MFIDDWQSFTGSAIRTWYDGVGYALVTEISPTLVGDYNDDGIVDAADYVVWRKNLGLTTTLRNRDTANSGPISTDDYNSWRKLRHELHSRRRSLAVPEPATIVLLVFAAAFKNRRYRPRLQRQYSPPPAMETV